MTLIFCYKIAHIVSVSLANQPIFFSVTRMYVHVQWDVREAFTDCKMRRTFLALVFPLNCKGRLYLSPSVKPPHIHYY